MFPNPPVDAPAAFRRAFEDHVQIMYRHRLAPGVPDGFHPHAQRSLLAARQQPGPSPRSAFPKRGHHYCRIIANKEDMIAKGGRRLTCGI